MTHALLFELNGIQQYLFASGKLRDVIGASELLDLLTNDQAPDNLLDAVWTQTPDNDRIEFSRRAGGAFYAFCPEREPLESFMRLWTLAVQQWAPDIDYNIALGEGENHHQAFKAARDKLRADQSRQRPRLPVAAPVAERNRRTGNVAEIAHQRDGLIDAATARKKAFADISKAGFIERFSPDGAALGWRDWPLDMEPTDSAAMSQSGPLSFPFIGDDRTVALIHADGNGLGQVLLNINRSVDAYPERFMQAYKQLSALIEKSTVHAARKATQEVLLPDRARENPNKPLAARPILLGGEDVIVIVRADLAFDYMTVFARAFEQESRKLLAEMKQLGIDNLPKRLTLGFGAVFLRASQPFHMGIVLAEEIMAEGKKTAKKINGSDPAATLQFQRITSSLVDDYDTLIERQLTHCHGDTIYRDTLGTYFLENIVPRLSDLRGLAELLGKPDMARGATRQLLTLIGLSADEARTRYRRWRQLMRDNNRQMLEHFDSLMAHLLGIERLPEDLPYGPADTDGVRLSPLADALALMSATKGDRTVTERENAA